MAIIGLGALALFFPLVYVFETNSRVEVLGDRERLYVIIGITRWGNKLSPAYAAVCAVVTSYFARDCAIDARRDELFVFEVTATAVTRHQVDRFPARGHSYIYDGQLYDVPFGGSSRWRWGGDHFEQVDEPQAQQSEQTSGSHLGHDGWYRKDRWDPDSSGNTLQTTIDGVAVTISVEGFLNEPPRTTDRLSPVKLRALLDGHPLYPKRILLESDPEPRWFRYGEYASLDPDAGPF